MTITAENIVALIGYVLLFITGYLTFSDRSEGTKIVKLTGTGTYLVDMNKAVELANSRALRAEEETVKIESRAEARELALEMKAKLRESEMLARIAATETQMNTLREYLSYRMTFQVKLGPNPIVEEVNIEYFPERRLKENNVVGSIVVQERREQ